MRYRIGKSYLCCIYYLRSSGISCQRLENSSGKLFPKCCFPDVVAADPTQNQNLARQDAVNAPAAATETVTITVTVRERKNESDHSHAHHRVHDLGQPRVHAPHRLLQSSARKKTNKLLRVGHPVQTKYLISSK